MISYEIKRNKPVVAQPQHQWWVPKGAIQQVGFSLKPPINLNNEPLSAVVGMGKYQYAQWLNKHVYPKFSKGTLVTIKRVPFVVDKVPSVWFQVQEIQEIHYAVAYDRDLKEPKAVGITHEGKEGIPIYYPPAMLRPLYESEVLAIDKLRNQESEGRNLESSDGDAIVVDRSTGEILKTEKDI